MSRLTRTICFVLALGGLAVAAADTASAGYYGLFGYQGGGFSLVTN